MAVAPNHASCVARSTFASGYESLVIECRGNMELEIACNGAASRIFRFDDGMALVFFQNDLERELVRNGWTLINFQSTCHCEMHPELPPHCRRGDNRS